MIVSHILIQERIQAHTKRESGANSASVLIQVQRERNYDITRFILIKNAGTHDKRERCEKHKCFHKSAKREK